MPAIGLSMTCTYCAHVAAVPDAEKRRERMEREARRIRQEERAAQEAEERREAEEEQQEEVQRKTRKVMRWGKLVGLVWTLGIFVFIAAILNGQRLFEPLIGDPGLGPHNALLADFDRERLFTLRPAETVGAWPGLQERYLELEAGRCYFLLFGAGVPLRQIGLNDPSGGLAASHTKLSLKAALHHCARDSGLHEVQVALDQPGRFTWSVLVDRPAPPPVPVTAAVTPADADPAPKPRPRPVLAPKVVEGALTPLRAESSD